MDQYLAQLNPSLFSGHFNTSHLNNTTPSLLDRLLNPTISPTFEVFHPTNDQFPPQTHSFSNSNNSASASSEEDHLSVINERKKRRMISNRESARRSRMRKQRHLDELWTHVVRLQDENRRLINKLNDMSERHEKVLQENVELKEEATDLRQMIKDLQLHSPFDVLRDLELSCNTEHLRAELTNQAPSNDLGCV